PYERRKWAGRGSMPRRHRPERQSARLDKRLRRGRQPLSHRLRRGAFVDHHGLRADDRNESGGHAVTIRETCAELARHPARYVIARWHWKSALMSAIFRGLVFFVANLGVGVGRAGRASIVEFALRVPLVGILASVAQLFRLAHPAWAAAIVT